VNSAQALELERLKRSEAVGPLTKKFQQRAAEIDGRTDRRSGAWHAARGKLKFERIVAGVEDSLRIREELIWKCPELGTPQHLQTLERQIYATIAAQYQQALKTFEIEGIRPLPSVISEAQATIYGLKATVSRKLRMIELQGAGNQARPTDASSLMRPIPNEKSADQTLEHSPRVFMSYSWDNPEHKQWVRDLAARLRQEDGVNVILDCWFLRPGGDKTVFMEKGVVESDFVILVCTEDYAARGNQRSGGVGYEAMIITGELAENITNSKFIPILRRGGWSSSLPSWIKTRVGLDLRNDPYSEEQYQELVRTIHQDLLEAPAIGPRRITARSVRNPEAKTPSDALAGAETNLAGAVTKKESEEAERTDYKMAFRALDPVAVKLHQTEVHAPEHTTWEVVKCESCGQEFAVGCHMLYPTGREREYIEKLKIVLISDHKADRSHANLYNLEGPYRI